MPDKITEEELIRELQSVSELLGHPPTPKEYEKYAPYSKSVYGDRFGNWSNALEEAGLDVPDNSRAIPKQKLLDDFERVGRNIGRTPTANDMEKHGEYSPSTYGDAFGTWSEMVDVSTLDPWEMGSGEDHPAWDGGHDENYYYGPNWQAQRQKAMARDNHRCQTCGMQQEDHIESFGHGLHVHHIIPVWTFDEYDRQNSLKNLITLCQDCHNMCEGWNLRPDV